MLKSSMSAIAVGSLWLSCTLGFIPSALHGQTAVRHEQAGRAATAERRMLDPANIPSWLETGKFRSARWDGGLIEAKKASLTGWAHYDENDPLQMLQATSDWYNPRTIEYLKIAHLNWAWVTWSNGFSPETELQQTKILSKYISLCHQNNIRVTAYISIGNMFWKDMFEHVPESIAWVKHDFTGAPLFYTRPNRYMADIGNPAWIALEKERVSAAARAGADALWIDNTFAYYRIQDVSRLIDALYDVASKINPQFVIMSNYNQGLYTWERLQNGVTTEDGEEPGYYTDKPEPYLVTNAGLLRYNFGVSEGWRPVSVEDGLLHSSNRMLTSMQSEKWQLAIAECAMYHASLEAYFEGRFLRDVYFNVPEAVEKLRAMGAYNRFLEQNEQYYTHPQSVARVAVLSDTTDAVVPYLNQLSENNLNYDVIFNYQLPREAPLKQYKVIVLPNTNPVSKGWCDVLAKWVRQEGGTLIVVQDASLFSTSSASGNQDFGLGALLGISKHKIPSSTVALSRGKGAVVYAPNLPPPGDMFSLIQRYSKPSELVEVEARQATLSNIAYQPAYHRVVLHVLNYRQELEKGLRVEVRAPVEKVEVLSPDSLSETKAQIQDHGDSWEIVIPELKTYDLVAIYLSGDTVAGYGLPQSNSAKTQE
jgi:hypothetical protein